MTEVTLIGMGASAATLTQEGYAGPAGGPAGGGEHAACWTLCPPL